MSDWKSPIFKKVHSIHDQRGGLVLTALVSIVIITLGMFLMSDYMSHIYQQEQASYIRKKLEILRQSMTSFIRSDASWTQTISHSANSGADFGCLATKSCATTAKAFALFDPTGVKLSDPSNPAYGTDLNGSPCNKFSKTNPDTSCVARYEFTWVVDCTSCVFQAPRVFGKLEFSFPAKFPVNTSNFQIDFARGKETGTIGETCASMKGALDTVTGQCRLPFAGVPCGTASSMNGTLANGEVNCQQSPGFGLQACPFNTKPVGINNQGEILCAQR